MKIVNTLAAILVIVGALNWGLVAIAEFDLVAALFADGFGTTSALSRVVYALVGLSAVYHAVSFFSTASTARATDTRDRVHA